MIVHFAYARGHRSQRKKIATTCEVQPPNGNARNQIVTHLAYSLSYSNKHEQAEWVFYLLTREMLSGSAKRTNDFKEDKDVELGSALSSDYAKSGYDRGHLCPSADIKFDAEAQSETFYMSNMSPQQPYFNRGMWKKLEEFVRNATWTHDSIYVVAGPVLRDNLPTIGQKNRVSVPEYFYKIIYSRADGGHMTAYLMPNAKIDGQLSDYVVSVDSVEALTGIDFFPKIKNEELLESSTSDTAWW